MSHEPWVVILGQMCQGVSSIPGQMWSWGGAQPLQGLSSLLDSLLPLLHTQTGICSSVKTRELPPWFPQDSIESLCSWQPGVSKVTPAGRTRTTDLPDRVKLAAQRKASCNICEQSQPPLNFFSLVLGCAACLALLPSLPWTDRGQESPQYSGKAWLPTRHDSCESCRGKRLR